MGYWRTGEDAHPSTIFPLFGFQNLAQIIVAMRSLRDSVFSVVKDSRSITTEGTELHRGNFYRPFRACSRRLRLQSFAASRLVLQGGNARFLRRSWWWNRIVGSLTRPLGVRVRDDDRAGASTALLSPTFSPASESQRYVCQITEFAAHLD